MKEHDIRPKALFDEFLKLARQDAVTYFVNASTVKRNCPACQGPGEAAFAKNGFEYAHCPQCSTLYVSPMPGKAAFRAFYVDSPSTRFWAETFYPVTAQARRKYLWKPKALQICDFLRQYMGIPCLVVDIGGGFGLFAMELMSLGQDVLVVEPSAHLAQACRSAGIRVVERFLEDVSGEDIGTEAKCFVSFELFEHLYDPEDFLRTLAKLMGPYDIFIFTTLSGTGADILALWQNSPSVNPPHHINFFNPKSIQILLKRTGFDLIEVSTPGRLDISIMENNREHLHDQFWSKTLKHATAVQKEKLQQSLSANLLSSHMMVLARKAVS